jgi:hypothetical protein
MLGRRHVYKLSRLILTKLSKTLFEQINIKLGNLANSLSCAGSYKIIKGIMKEVVHKN